MTPFELRDQIAVGIQVERNGATTPAVLAGINPVALIPQVFAIANADGTINSQSSPAHSGAVVTVYASGFGDTHPSLPDGAVYQTPLPVPVYAVTGYATQVSYAGPAPGMVAGIWQINFIAPQELSDVLVRIQLASSDMTSGYTPTALVYVWIAP